MRMSLAVLLNSLLILSIPTPLVAKGKTVKITIKGADLKTPIAITDRKILANFQVWTGPGTSTADRQSLIIDWSQGPVRKAPESLRRYQVSFHTDPNEQIVYVVYYAFSLGAEQGYVYLPGDSDEWARLNVGTIFHGVEGNWFRAWSAWERVARPLIEKAELTDSNQARQLLVRRETVHMTGQLSRLVRDPRLDVAARRRTLRVRRTEQWLLVG